MKTWKTMFVGCCVGAFAAGATAATTGTPFATTTMMPKSGARATGTVDFAKAGHDVVVTIELRDVPPGKHGLHVHANGDCSAADASSAGGHFNPTGRHHGSPTDIDRHVGDLGNVEAGTDRRVHAEVRLGKIKGFDWSDFVGRSLVLHENADDFVTQPSGNSGKRIACGVIRSVGSRAAR